MYQNVSHFGYACIFTSVCMEWDHHICRRCASRSHCWLVVVICIQLSVNNSLFPVTDSGQLAEGHFLSLACHHGTYCYYWQIDSNTDIDASYM